MVFRLRLTPLVVRLLFPWVGIAFAMGVHAQEPAPAPTPKLDGHTLFVERGCAHCHGPLAAGAQDAPDLHGVGQRMKPEEIRSQIVSGGKSMPAFGDALTPEETDTLVEWVRSLKSTPTTKSKAHRHGSW